MANFIDFSCFVSMFPHLVAGPILKFSFLAEQLKHRTPNEREIRARRRVFHARSGEENPARESVRQNRRHRFRCRIGRHARRLVRLDRLRVPNLFRLQRLLGHGDRPRADARFRLREEFRFTLPRGIDHRFLAALAHLAFHLAARVSLHSARRKSAWPCAHLRQPHLHHVARRALARRVVEFRHLGRDARRHARLRAQPGARRLLSQSAHGRCASSITFVIVLLGWVFFRASDLPRGVRLSRQHVRAASRRCRAPRCSAASFISRTICSR